MANDDTASKRRAEEIIARYTINLRRAFSDLVPALKHAYGQDAADTLSPHVLALKAIALFLDQTMKRSGHSREEAAKRAAKAHPELEQLITERGVHRSDDVETAMRISAATRATRFGTRPLLAPILSVSTS